MSTATLEFLRKKAAALTREIEQAKGKRQRYGHLQRRRIQVVAQIVRETANAQHRGLAQRPSATVVPIPQLPF